MDRNSRSSRSCWPMTPTQQHRYRSPRRRAELHHVHPTGKQDADGKENGRQKRVPIFYQVTVQAAWLRRRRIFEEAHVAECPVGLVARILSRDNAHIMAMTNQRV